MRESLATAALPLSEELLDEVKKRIVHAFAPERVILFGSYAERRATTDLDKTIAQRVLNRLRWLADNFETITPEPLTGEWRGLFKLRIAGEWNH